MYGGFVIPTRSMHPSGTPSRSTESSSGIDEPMSRPYAPVSSDVSQISTTPCARGGRCECEGGCEEGGRPRR